MELCDQFESVHKVVYSKKNYRACRHSGQARQGGEFSRTPVNCNNNNSGLFYDYVSHQVCSNNHCHQTSLSESRNDIGLRPAQGSEDG